jgi:hypothetical protein
MAAAKLDIVVEQGATFLRTLTLKDGAGVLIDLTGYTVRGQIRSSQNASSIAATFTGTVLNQTTNKGQASLLISATDTSSIPGDAEQVTPPLKASKYLYDIEMVDGSGVVTRLLQGNVTLVPEITK